MEITNDEAAKDLVDYLWMYATRKGEVQHLKFGEEDNAILVDCVKLQNFCQSYLDSVNQYTSLGFCCLESLMTDWLSPSQGKEIYVRKEDL